MDWRRGSTRGMRDAFLMMQTKPVSRSEKVEITNDTYSRWVRWSLQCFAEIWIGHINKTRLDRFESVYSVYYLQTSQYPKSTALNSHENPNTIQFSATCFSPSPSPSGTHPLILDVRQCSAKVSKAVNKSKVPQLLIAQRQQDFQRKMRHPSSRNIHRSSTRHYEVSRKFKLY